MRSIHFTALTLSLASAACDSVEARRHLDEPIVVQDGTFESGELRPDDSADATITSVSFSLGSVRAGARSVPVSGRVGGNAYSVAFALEGQGSGYWVRKAGFEDATYPGELTFDVLLDVGENVKPGLTKLAITPIDGDGKAGTPQALDLCVLSEVPDNGNVCDDTIEPPQAIISLTWNSDADLDLVIVSPSGKIYNRSRRGVAGDDGKPLASFDFDSNSGCVLDNHRTENFVFNEAPEQGGWLVYVDLFDACGSTAAEFTVTTHERRQTGDDTFDMHKTSTTRGVLLRSQADGAAGTPLYVQTFNL